jgi:hypothetical protein
MRKARKAKEKKKVIYTKTLSGKRMFMYDTLPKEVRLYTIITRGPFLRRW